MPKWFLTEGEKAYIAGIIDGEGSICSMADKDHFHLRLSIYNTDLRLINWLMEKISGLKISIDKHAAKNRKTCYAVYLGNQEVVELLSLVKDYMVIKKDRAEFLLQEYPKKFEVNRSKREFIHNRMKQFNNPTSIPSPIGQKMEE